MLFRAATLHKRCLIQICFSLIHTSAGSVSAYNFVHSASVYQQPLPSTSMTVWGPRYGACLLFTRISAPVQFRDGSGMPGSPELSGHHSQASWCLFYHLYEHQICGNPVGQTQLFLSTCMHQGLFVGISPFDGSWVLQVCGCISGKQLVRE